MRLLRRHYSLTQQQIADKMGVSRASYQYAESLSPTGVFDRLARFWLTEYGITPNELLINELTEYDCIKLQKQREALVLNPHKFHISLTPQKVRVRKKTT